MDQLRSELLKTISHIEDFCTLLVIGRYDEAEQYISIIIGLFNEIIPKIVKCYMKKQFLADQDSSIWVIMLKRITTCISLDDDFQRIDAFEDMAELLRLFHSLLESQNE